MSELYDLGSGYWPDELDNDGNFLNEGLDENHPWENWRLHLFGGEAGDILEEKSEVDKVLKNLGYKIVKDDEWISVGDRLPDANVCVLVNVFRKRSHTAPEADFICTAKLNRVTRHYGKGSPVDDRWYVFPSGGHELTGSVTHWKPLPEPPK